MTSERTAASSRRIRDGLIAADAALNTLAANVHDIAIDGDLMIPVRRGRMTVGEAAAFTRQIRADYGYPPAPDLLTKPATAGSATGTLCGCGCGKPIPARSPSGYFVDGEHQEHWYRSQTTSPDQIYETGDGHMPPSTWNPGFTGGMRRLTPIDGNYLPEPGPYSYRIGTYTDEDSTVVLRVDDGIRYIELTRPHGCLPTDPTEHAAWARPLWDSLEHELANPRYGPGGWQPADDLNRYIDRLLQTDHIVTSADGYTTERLDYATLSGHTRTLTFMYRTGDVNNRNQVAVLRLGLQTITIRSIQDDLIADMAAGLATHGGRAQIS